MQNQSNQEITFDTQLKTALYGFIHLQMIASLKCQYAELLCDIGFIKADLTARKMGRLAPRTGDGVLAATGDVVSL